ncbi:MAG: SpoIVB peptidase [Oscillospiraceae bacterium]|nr:SpoIVB peptidase [Oscillospiraceae bacterium]
MRSLIKIFSFLCTVVCAVLFSLIYFGQKAIPDSITTVENNGYEAPKILGVSLFNSDVVSKTGVVLGTAQASQNEAKISLLNIIPVKSTKITNSKRQYVIPGGEIFGIKLYTDGTVVVGMDSIESENGEVNPAEKAGLKIGDIIKSVNGEKVTSTAELAGLIEKSAGSKMNFFVLRDESFIEIEFQSVKEKSSGKYKAGLWVRDSTAGIGTVTFYNPENSSFGGLGHAICDIDTDEIMPMAQGDMAEAYVNGLYKSSAGNVGELCGVFTGNNTGILCINDETGIYGYTSCEKQENPLPVAVKQEIHDGYAQIICTIDKNPPEYYDVKIVKVFSNSSTVNKDMIIEITDERLMSKTGGILQGMSGTPIIQDGMLVGAITHVFVNNPKQGYAIFAERMLETSVCREMQKFIVDNQSAA